MLLGLPGSVVVSAIAVVGMVVRVVWVRRITHTELEGPSSFRAMTGRSRWGTAVAIGLTVAGLAAVGLLFLAVLLAPRAR